jgi:molybdopterin-guanine dinucleotide biosynthesis protein
MKIICITGAMSGVGKTTLSEKLLSRLENWVACKVTACVGGKKHRCPRGMDDTCGVCVSLDENYVIEDSSEVIAVLGKDTGRLLSAGAEKVLWVKARPKFVSTAVEKVIHRLQGYDGIIFEGNHALKHLNPDLALMVLSRDGKYKRSAKNVIDKVDIFIEWENEDEQVGRIIESIDHLLSNHTTEESRGVSSFTKATD